MTEYTMHIDGMMCGMCESHMNDAIRKLDPKAKKVSSSHRKGISKFRSEQSFDEAALRARWKPPGITSAGSTSQRSKKREVSSSFRDRWYFPFLSPKEYCPPWRKVLE